MAVARIPNPDGKRILDLGCGTGATGSCLKSRNCCEVVGVMGASEEFEIAKWSLDR